VAESKWSGRAFRQYVARDPSSWALLLSNLAVMVVVLLEGWSLAAVMVIYWYQSVIIGVFTLLRMMSVRMIITETPVPAGHFWIVKAILGGFFALHYGLFHFGYYEFLRGSFGQVDPGWLRMFIALFVANHLFSFFHNFKIDIREQDIMRLMISPYPRIIPMHTTIVFGMFILFFVRGRTGEIVVLILFLGLKGWADLLMHVADRTGEFDLLLPEKMRRKTPG
jgi:hypothetical protein